MIEVVTIAGAVRLAGTGSDGIRKAISRGKLGRPFHLQYDGRTVVLIDLNRVMEFWKLQPLTGWTIRCLEDMQRESIEIRKGNIALRVLHDGRSVLERA